MNSAPLNVCRICESHNLEKYLDLGKQPFSNSFLKVNQIKKEKRFPLIILLCKKCGLSQLSIIPNTKFIFSKYDYLSSSSSALSNHYKSLIKKLISRYSIKSSEIILDIGCNDGILLQHFPKSFKKLIGIEPSDASKHIKDRRIKLRKEFFNYKTSQKLLKKFNKPKLITITNVLAQIPNLKDFVKGLKNLLNEKNIIVIEFPYLIDMINSSIFDVIYHEHLSYFSLTPLNYLFKKNNIQMLDFERINFGASGPAIRLYLANNISIYKQSKKINQILDQEKLWEIKKIRKYKKFKIQVVNKIKKLKNIILTKHKQKFKLGCFTASSKGNTLLNCLKIKKNIMSLVCENNKKKIGKFTPGTHIKIVNDEKFNKEKIEYALLLSWNYKKFFMKKSEFIKKGGKFIVPFPTPHIEK
jgi:hypothetical protein